MPAARCIATLKQRAATAGVSIVYVNDNFGEWRTDFKSIVEHCLAPESRGRPIVQLLQPDVHDYFVLKPRNSGFYSTSLDISLRDLKITSLILCGIAGDDCVFFTANDAYLRCYQIIVPEDCVASNSDDENKRALAQMQKVLKADTRPSSNLRFCGEDKVASSGGGS